MGAVPLGDIHTHADQDADIFDYVVVGAGTAGCLITNRLATSGATVCLLEAGSHDRHPLIQIPAGYIKSVYSKQWTWGFASEPGPGVNGRVIPLPQGKIIGGSSSINGMNYVRGQAADYDNWAAAGNPGWSYAEVLPYFKRSERRLVLARTEWVSGGDPNFRGQSGAMPITDLDWRHPLNDALIDSAVAIGIPKNIDHNAGDQEGVGYFQRAIHHGLRQSSARVFLRPVETRANVCVLKSSQAMQILFEGKRAVGVRYIRGGPNGQKRTVRARREVIVSAGAINTPKLLQISGVGPGDVLARIGVPPVHILDGVGCNLRDHYAIRMVTRIKGIRTINQMAQGPALLVEITRWLLRRPSLLAVSPSMVHMFSRSSPTLDRPDLEFACAPASFREGIVGLLDKQAGLTIGVWQSRPESVGYVRARSSSAFDLPAIQPNYLTDERDQQALLGGMKLARKIAHAPPLAPYFNGDVAPAATLQADDELLDFARRTGTTAYHMVGSCRMGPMADPLAVVDHCLRVHGIKGLRIADASIMPSMPSANTNASTLMIAEKAADLILGKALEDHHEGGHEGGHEAGHEAAHGAVMIVQAPCDQVPSDSVLVD